MHAPWSCPLFDVSMVTRAGWLVVPSEKMKLKSLLAPVLPARVRAGPLCFHVEVCTGRVPGAEEKRWGPNGGVQSG